MVTCHRYSQGRNWWLFLIDKLTQCERELLFPFLLFHSRAVLLTSRKVCVLLGGSNCQEPSCKAPSGACWECHLPGVPPPDTAVQGTFHGLLENSCSRGLSWKSHLLPLTHCMCGFCKGLALFLGVLIYKFLCEAPMFYTAIFSPKRLWNDSAQQPSVIPASVLGARGCVWCSISFYFLVYRLIFTWLITHPSPSVNTALV